MTFCHHGERTSFSCCNLPRTLHYLIWLSWTAYSHRPSPSSLFHPHLSMGTALAYLFGGLWANFYYVKGTNALAVALYRLPAPEGQNVDPTFQSSSLCSPQGVPVTTKTKLIYRIILRLHFPALVTNTELLLIVFSIRVPVMLRLRRKRSTGSPLQPLLLIRSCANACLILLKWKINWKCINLVYWTMVMVTLLQ